MPLDLAYPEAISEAEAWALWNDLEALNRDQLGERNRIRALLDGGREAVLTLLGNNTKYNGEDPPVVNLVTSGLSRLAHRVGITPQLRVPTSSGKKRERDNADLRRRIVATDDLRANLPMLFPQIGRWTPAYGYTLMVVKPKRGTDGVIFPTVEIRDPIATYPGWWGADGQPDEAACVRYVPTRKIAAAYPRAASAIETRNKAAASGSTIVVHGQASPGAIAGPRHTVTAEGPIGDTITTVELWHRSGTYLLCPSLAMVLDYYPNLCPDMSPFALIRRFPFDALKGQFDDLIGLLSMMAKLNVLSMIAAEDSVFRETNIIGELTSGAYRRGRFSYNRFAPGTRIERPTNDMSQQVFMQIDRLERQLRIGGHYPVTEDAISPNSWVTGQGLTKLTGGVDSAVGEYHTAIAAACQLIDSYRLSWTEAAGGGEPRPLLVGQSERKSEYLPSEIKGRYTTERIYGVMAGWDENAKIVNGMNLVAGKILPRQVVRENLVGLTDPAEMEDLIIQEDTGQALIGMLAGKAAQGDPRAEMALIEIHANPGQVDRILKKFYTPQAPTMSPEEMAMIQGAMAGQGAPGAPGAPGPGGPPGAPPSVSTMLNQIEAGGSEAGMQTVTRV